jgi:hypothetical protein
VKRIYIANQGEVDEIDEIRWLARALSRKKHISLSGDPGHGKSSAVRYVAKMLGKKVFSRNCQLHEQTFDYLGRPMLESGRTTYTRTQFTSALREGGILINEETSEMPPEIQKYLSTLLSDNYLDFVVLDERGNERTLAYMQEHEGWKIEDFIYVETFNPPKNNTGRDNFEFSHKSRVTPFTFRDLDSLLAAFIAFRLIEEDFPVPLTQRGILHNSDSGEWLFTEKRHDSWWTSDGRPLDQLEIKIQKTYLYFPKNITSDAALRTRIIDELKRKGRFYYDLLLFLAAARAIVNPDVFRYDSLGDKVSRMIPEKDKGELLLIVYPDQRMVTDGFEAYKDYRAKFGEATARLATTFDVLNKILHGALRDRELNNNSTQADFLKLIAAEAGLLPRPEDGLTEIEDYVREIPGGVGHGVGASFNE